MSPSRARRPLARLLIVIGTVELAVVAAVAIDATLFQHHARERLAGLEPRGSPPTLAVAAAARREAAREGVIGRMDVPRLRLSVVILEGTQSRALRRGVGHVERTAYPGEPGNVAIAGHRDTYFRRLEDIRVGDRVSVHTPDGLFAYEVDSVLVVPPTRVDLIAATAEPTLTLVTCYPFHWIGPAPRRFVVRAHASETNVPVSRRLITGAALRLAGVASH